MGTNLVVQNIASERIAPHLIVADPHCGDVADVIVIRLVVGLD